MEKHMKHYIVVTDTNSRQYIYEIPPEGFHVTSEDLDIHVKQDDPGLQSFNILMQGGYTFIVDDKAVFNSSNLVAVQYQSHEE